MFKSKYYSNDELVKDLKDLISEWEEEGEKLNEMRELWEEYDDPSWDPWLQYEQEMIIEEKFNDICEFCKEHLNNN